MSTGAGARESLGAGSGGGPTPRPLCPHPCGPASRSLEAISGLESGGRVFTVHVQGLLQLQVRPGAGGAAADGGQSWASRLRPGHCMGWVPPGRQPGPVGGDVHGGCLQAGQYTSVFVDNGSGTALTVQSGSSFSGLLLGT